jgi:nucleoside-diphosphate-sugar epimerase
MVNPTNKHLFCFGLGYTARNVIKYLQGSPYYNWSYTGTKRVTSLANENRNINLISFSENLIIPYETTHILISIPPYQHEDIVLKLFKQQILNLKNIEWIGYISSTGVYGNHNGNWVNESSQTLPSSPTNIDRLKVEKGWLNLYKYYNKPITIFRAAGIYGEGRNIIEKILNGENSQLIIAPNCYFSRIHIEDLAKIIIRSMFSKITGEIFNIADDYPCENIEVTRYTYQLLGIKPPSPVELKDAQISDFALNFYLDSKKVDNHKVKELLNYKLIYPTYKEGLTKIINKIHLKLKK